MKFKYYLRGLATGILFTAMIYYIISIGAEDNLSNAEIMKRAQALGMVKQEETLFDTSLESSDETSSYENDSYKSQSSVDYSVEESNTRMEDTDSSLEEVKGGKTASSLAEDSATIAVAEKPESSNVSSTITNGAAETLSFTIKTGMTAQEIINIIKEKGIIEDTGAFYEYLNDHEYSTSILPGNYEVQKDITYERLAKLITHTK